MPNFKKNCLKGFVHLGKFLPKIRIFTKDFSYLIPHFHVCSVEIWLKRMDLGIPQYNTIQYNKWQTIQKNDKIS